MRLTGLSALAALAAQLVNAHYTFPTLIVGSVTSNAWQYIRETQNFNTQDPVTDVTSQLLRCYENNTAAATSTYTVTAGSTISIESDGTIYHPGYFAVYMSEASPATNSESAGTGTTWFKIWEKLPTYSASEGLVFDQTETSMTFPVPAAVPNGQYLIRAEHIALHVASTFGGAQFYIGCAQVNIVGGGTGNPGPLVPFPGAYTGYEPGILIDIYNGGGVTSYTPPGPPVWTAGNSGATAPPPPPPATTTSKAPGTTAAPTGPTVAHYGQCGGQGYTGSTNCAAPYTCTYSNAYYSQCL